LILAYPNNENIFINATIGVVESITLPSVQNAFGELPES
jgi:hypothetical protein